MFSVNHFIWLAISFAAMAAALCYLKKNKPSLVSVLSVCCVLCILSEVTKTFSVLEMVPSSDGSTMHAYLEMGQVPLHLCSINALLLPIVVAFSYEINRFVGRHDNWFTRIISAPGLLLQRLTVFEPDDDMIECAITAMKEVIPADGSDKF